MQKKHPEVATPKTLAQENAKNMQKQCKQTCRKICNLPSPKIANNTQFIHNSIFQYLHYFCVFFIVFALFFVFCFFCFCMFVAFSSSFSSFSNLWRPEDLPKKQTMLGSSLSFHFCLHFFCTGILWLHFFFASSDRIFFLHFFKFLLS